MLLSLLFSTYSVYLLSLLIGFGRVSVTLTFLIFSVWLLLFVIKKRPSFGFSKNHLLIHFFALAVSVIYLVALFPAIFSFHNNYIVMLAMNWQDTAMHMGITESISQGNFPPQAPYFSGSPLSYYYFIDFHASIVETITGQFFPKVFAILNPFFIFLFIISVYALAWQITQKKTVSFISSFLAAFYGNFMSVTFAKDLIKLGNPLNLLATKGYTIDYFGTMNVSPMADYFLQNRPMMIGLPAFAITLTLLLIAFREKNLKLFFLVGLIASLFVKFQLFVGIAILISTGLGFLFFAVRHEKLKTTLQKIVFLSLGLIPGFIFLYFLKAGNNSFFELIKETFQYKPWGVDKTVWWKISFLIENFGIHLTLSFLTVLLVIFKKLNIKRDIIFLFLLAVTFFCLPFLVRFTIYDADMFKFFYISIIPISIIAALGLSALWQKHLLTKILVVCLLSISSITSLLCLGNSYFNKNFAYSMDDYVTGLWIRENTPRKSVFLENPKVHSSITEIGGRLRTLSYITWPYSHGFNTGEDNVFSRLDDIKAFYKDPTIQLLEKYKVNYVYLGHEERHEFPDAEKKFENIGFLTKVYAQDDISIYKVN